MAKQKTIFFCQNCGASSAKWIGNCPSCKEWNTYVEEVVEKSSPAQVPAWVGDKAQDTQGVPKRIATLEAGVDQRIETPDAEFNRVLGGGIVNGSLVLIGGEPGIGKSTLLLQIALRLDRRVLYISGEESESQLKMRADRLGIANEACYILAATDLQSIFKEIKKLQPEILIVDSIQTLFTRTIESTPGSISQIRECTGQLLRYAKDSGTPVFLIGHITKDGHIAGPKVLEHMVDTVLQFEGDRHHVYRILRAVKNRFGSASELGIYEMAGEGLREVLNPSEVLISESSDQLSGISITAALEGVRPLLIETQALVSTAVYGTPQRNANGYDLRRLNMLLAVLEKRCGFKLGIQDVFVNVAGGLRLDDPGSDLGIAAAILSSYENIPLSRSAAFVGEIGLSGEVRAVSRIEQRISEAEKLGLEEVILSKRNLKNPIQTSVKLIGVNNIMDVAEYLFG
ncbi:MAG: DNA repair protein RadA [Flavobacteriales bacterium]|nr:DNA repair protein RadA [Bacteroidota bacterium]MCB9240773.1 DNA repair protein RadA [Flavobacteriales bacterium]